MTSVKVNLQVDENGELLLPLDDPIFSSLGWKVGDKLLWSDNGDGSWTLSKKPATKIVLVDCIQSYRMRYAVEIPEDAPNEWALDTVTCMEANEFSQLPLEEQIVSHRVITEEEMVKQFREDNDYLRNWTAEQCIDSGLTKWEPKR